MKNLHENHVKFLPGTFYQDSSKQDHKEIKDIFTLNGMSQVINDDTRFDIHHNISTLIYVLFVKNGFAVTRTSVISM